MPGLEIESQCEAESSSDECTVKVGEEEYCPHSYNHILVEVCSHHNRVIFSDKITHRTEENVLLVGTIPIITELIALACRI
jgi:hypothetical protein